MAEKNSDGATHQDGVYRSGGSTGLSAYLVKKLLEAAGGALDTVPTQRPFTEFGVTSLTALKFIRSLEAEFGKLSKTLLFETHNLRELADYLRDHHAEVAARLETAPAEAAQQPAPAAAAPTKAVATIETAESAELLTADALHDRPDLVTRMAALTAASLPHPPLPCPDLIAPMIFTTPTMPGFFYVVRAAGCLTAESYVGEPAHRDALAAALAAYAQTHDLGCNILSTSAETQIGGRPCKATPLGHFQQVDPTALKVGPEDRAHLAAELPDYHAHAYPSGSRPEEHADLCALVDAWCAHMSPGARVHALQAALHADTLPAHRRVLLTYHGKTLHHVCLVDILGDQALILHRFDRPGGHHAGPAFAYLHALDTLAEAGVTRARFTVLPGEAPHTAPNADPELAAELRDLGDLVFQPAEEAALRRLFGTEDHTLFLLQPEGQEGPSMAQLVSLLMDPPPSPGSLPPAVPTPEVAARQTPAVPAPAAGEIAVIGMAGRFPMAGDLTRFWENLVAGRTCITPFPEHRRRDYADPVMPFESTELGGYLDDVSRFDALFFNISPREAALIDPQERLFLETAWAALEDAAVVPEHLPRKTAVFVGAVWSHYQVLGHERVQRGLQAPAQSFLWSIANRVSTFFDINGPSMCVDTACSASMTALHLACQSLLCGESEAAVVGGVNLDLHPIKRRITESAKALSADGRCRAFGAGAGGYVPGEGVVALLLKPLEAARRDGDRIQGVILATAVNHGGNASGYTVPNPKAQARLVQEALARAGRCARDLSYIEAHGTGTELGDPIEIRGLSMAMGDLADHHIPVGSVKTNIGHLEAAAGLAGVVKVLLQMAHDTLVPSLHAEELNPHIDFARTPFRVQTRLAPWPRTATPRLAGVSAFGAGGANAHVILSDGPQPPRPPDDGGTEVVPLSGRTREALRAAATALAAHCTAHPDTALRAVAHTLQVGRRAHKHRLAFTVGSLSALTDALHAWLDGAATGPWTTGLIHGEPESVAASAPPHLEAAEAAAAWCAGAFAQGVSLMPHRPGIRIALPGTVFDGPRHWLTDLVSTTDTAPSSVAAAPARAVIPPPHAQTLCYRPVWYPFTDPAAAEPESLLLFDMDARLCDSLRAQWPVPITLVRPATTFAATSDGYTIDPVNPDHVRDLVHALQEGPGLPSHGLFLWPLRTADSDTGAQLDIGLHPLFYLARTLKLKRDQPLRLLYLCRDDRPIDTAVGAFARSLRQEQPGFMLTVVRCDAATDDAALPALVAQEWGCKEPETAHVQGTRLLPAWEPLAPTHDAGPVLRRGGIYIITGGLGGLGLIFARHLAEHYAARLVLSGRSPASARTDAQVAQLRALGGDAHYLAADISRKADCARLVAETQAHFGTPHGVLHGAGVLRDSLLHTKRRADFDTVLAPKLHGTLLLDEACADLPLDFFVLCSSIASMFGNAGQSDYAYANRFMDDFAQARRALVAAGTRHGVTVSLNWPLWAEGGMQVDEAHEKWMARAMGLYAMTTQDGITAFEQALTADTPVVCVLFCEPDKLGALVAPKTPAPVAAPVAASAGTAAPTRDLGPEIEDDLKGVIAELLHVDEADIDPLDQMADYGFDSLTFTELANEVNARLNLDLIPTVFYELLTLRDLSDFLQAEYPDKVAGHYGADVAEAAPPAAPAVAVAPPMPVAPPAAQPQPQPVAPREAGPASPVAVIGMAGIFPGSPDLDAFWQHLVAGDDLITEVPASRWDWQAFYGDPQGPENLMRAHWGGFVPDFDCFDSLYFGIPPREAALMDPQHRLFIETTWEALARAGTAPAALAGTRTGVFVGIATMDYSEYLQQLGIEAEGYFATGNAHCMLPNRISYLLDLQGPSEALDTACSSALLAIHRAVEGLQTGSCELAIAGAVNILLNPIVQVSFDKAGLLSPDGRCRSFDKDAAGYSRGEGAGAVILKSLDRALADGDPIAGIIRASAVRHAGRAGSLTAPNPAGQVKLLEDAWKKAGVAPATAGYLEAHGSGTELGDSMEFNSARKAFESLNKFYGATAEPGHCGLGSVRSNVGHLDTVTGMAAVFKVLLGMRHARIPATVHFREPNGYIKTEGSPFTLSGETRPWPQAHDASGRPLPRRAGINSFSFGGLNAHLVLEAFTAPVPETSGRARLIVLSARNEERLRAYAGRLAAFLEADPGPSPTLDQVAYTLQRGREALPERLAFAASDLSEAVAGLAAFAAGGKPKKPCHAGTVPKKKSDLVRLFEGREGQGFVAEVIRNQNLDKLGLLFLQGISVPWELLYDSPPTRVALPGYPFQRVRHWVDAPQGWVWGRGTGTAPVSQTAAPHAAASTDPVTASPEADAATLIADLITAMTAAFLGMEPTEIDRDGDLGDYGLNSFTGGRLALQLQDRLRFSLPLSALYDYPSINELAAFLADQVDAAVLRAPAPAAEATVAAPRVFPTSFPPSVAQRALWFLHEMQPHGTAWHLPMALRLHPPLDEAALIQALETLLTRHDAARTVFRLKAGNLVQTVLPQAPEVTRIDAGDLDLAALQQRVHDTAFAPFVGDGPLFRATLFVHPEACILLLVAHHLVMDGSSFAVLINELKHLYADAAAGRTPSLPPLQGHFSDFVAAETAMLEGPRGEALRSFWCNQLRELPRLTLPVDHPRGAHATDMRVLEWRLDADTLAAARGLAGQGKASLFMVLLTVLKVLLARYTNQWDFAVGTPFANRGELRFQDVWGYFINMLPVRAPLGRRRPAADLIAGMKKTVLAALDHGAFPFAAMVEALAEGRDAEDLFNVCMVFQSEVGDVADDMFSAAPRGEGLNLELVEWVHEQGGYDLTLEVFEFPDHCRMFSKYDAALFEPARMEALGSHFAALTRAMAAAPHTPVGYLSFLPEAEKTALLAQCTGPAADAAPPRPMHHLIAQTAAATPDAVAVVAGTDTLTYAQLDARASQLARGLLRRGVGPENHVGLCLPRGLDLAVGLLGILKAGACYLPIDPAYPEDRRALMLAESGARLVLTCSAYADRFDDPGVAVLALDGQWAQFAAEPTHDPAAPCDASQSAYLIFTSGSTGRPKGVPISHGALVHYARAFRDAYRLHAGDRMLQFASISFDTAVEEIFPTLMVGACLVFRPPEQMIEPADLMALCRAQHITILDLPTAYWHLWLSEIEDTARHMPPDLRLVIVGGEQVSAARLGQWIERVGDRVVWTNTYGPTETTIAATHYELTAAP